MKKALFILGVTTSVLTHADGFSSKSIFSKPVDSQPSERKSFGYLSATGRKTRLSTPALGFGYRLRPSTGLIAHDFSVSIRYGMLPIESAILGYDETANFLSYNAEYKALCYWGNDWYAGPGLFSTEFGIFNICGPKIIAGKQFASGNYRSFIQLGLTPMQALWINGKRKKLVATVAGERFRKKITSARDFARSLELSVGISF